MEIRKLKKGDVVKFDFYPPEVKETRMVEGVVVECDNERRVAVVCHKSYDQYFQWRGTYTTSNLCYYNLIRG